MGSVRLKARKEYVSPGALAVLYVALGDPERALELLERAYVEHDNQLYNLAVHPQLDPLRSDGAFKTWCVASPAVIVLPARNPKVEPSNDERPWWVYQTDASSARLPVAWSRP